MKAIVNGRAILTGKRGKFYTQKDTHILFDKNIEKIFVGEIPAEISNLSPKNITDAKNKYVSPGFINMHVHGALGADTMDETDDSLKIFAKAEVSMGVTSFLPTTMSYDIPRVQRAFERIKKAMLNNSGGAKILGANMEGPYIAKTRAGAQDAKYIKQAEFSDIADFTDIVKIITLAPETVEDDFIEKAKKCGVILSIGHSDATYEEAFDAIKKGKVSHITHLYNAMTPFHHRKPGIVGAAFDTEATAELIADNVHSSPMAQRLAHKMKGIEKIILITDSMRAACLGDGMSELGGQKVTVRGNLATLENGAIAGSVAKMNDVIRIFKENTGVKTEEAVEAATKNPAKLLKMYDKIGSIEIHKSADFAVFDDEFKIFMTVVDGLQIFHTNPQSSQYL